MTYLILCHRDPSNLRRLVRLLDCPEAAFVIHVDKNVSLEEFRFEAENVLFVPENKRIGVRWGSISIVDAMLVLLDVALSAFTSDYYWFCSGQDLPLASPATICDKLRESSTDFIHFSRSLNNGSIAQTHFDKRNQIYTPEWLNGKSLCHRLAFRMYIELTGGYSRTFRPFRRRDYNRFRFYYGSAWLCLRREVARWILEYLSNHPELHAYYMRSVNSDESIFHTVYMLSPYAGEDSEYLHYIDWSEGGRSPKVLDVADVEKAIISGKINMARHFWTASRVC